MLRTDRFGVLGFIIFVMFSDRGDLRQAGDPASRGGHRSFGKDPGERPCFSKF